MAGIAESVQREAKPNNTGLPGDLKSGIENLSGYSLDDVRVHYNSATPSRLQAHAYAQGAEIHIAPGQEKHLPHEAWHVVQQKQGRVRPTVQFQGVAINDDDALESEADRMGREASGYKERKHQPIELEAVPLNKIKPIQLLTVDIRNETYKIIYIIEGTPYVVVRKNWHPFSTRYIYKSGEDNYRGVMPMNSDQADMFAAIMRKLRINHVNNLEEIIDSIFDSPALPTELIIARLSSINDAIQSMVLPRIEKDHDDIVRMSQGNILNSFSQAFVSLEIPGSDPHKGGQVVAIINYNRNGGGTLKMVYKPGMLHVDQFLYSTTSSIAAKMPGNPLPSYAITREVDRYAPDEMFRHYGYMEYISTEGPQTAAEVLSVYNSLGQNLAIAYVFGLRDIHYQNFILKRDSVLFIDMEAATGTFTGFNTLEFAGLPQKLAKKIRDNLNQHQLININNWLPQTVAFKQSVMNGFFQGLNLIPRIPNLDNDIQYYSRLETRFVPFPTSELQYLCARFFGHASASDTNYDRAVSNLAGQMANGLPALQNNLFLLLTHQDTIEAINRGDIPFWTRVGNDIYGEKGELIIQNFDHPRLQDSVVIGQGVTNRVNNPFTQLVAIGQLRNVLIPMLRDPRQDIIGP